MSNQPSRRSFLQTAATAPLAAAAESPAQLDAVHIARRHSFIRDLPTPNFFEGMLLGNGDIGVCAVCRPDALGLHIGKLDVWDIRVSEDHIRHMRTFDEVLKLWAEASERAKQAGKPELTRLERNDPELNDYHDKVRSSYSKPWPRPWPCGTVWLHWDSRFVRVKRQLLDISTGIYRLELLHDGQPAHLDC
ncbi:MAG: twin-arginine translocation signal domain-containing protein, partial [bacterium]|nr:twin-arginine translocation signal domain-containing protein [bacterium]